MKGRGEKMCVFISSGFSVLLYTCLVQTVSPSQKLPKLNMRINLFHHGMAHYVRLWGWVLQRDRIHSLTSERSRRHWFKFELLTKRNLCYPRYDCPTKVTFVSFGYIDRSLMEERFVFLDLMMTVDWAWSRLGAIGPHDTGGSQWTGKENPLRLSTVWKYGL